MTSSNLPYSIQPARYSKGKFTIITRDASDGFKGRCGSIADELKLKYVGRSGGYRASAAQVAKFERRFLEVAI